MENDDLLRLYDMLEKMHDAIEGFIYDEGEMYPKIMDERDQLAAINGELNDRVESLEELVTILQSERGL